MLGVRVLPAELDSTILHARRGRNCERRRIDPNQVQAKIGDFYILITVNFLACPAFEFELYAKKKSLLLPNLS
jgi:hypothetical protein